MNMNTEAFSYRSIEDIVQPTVYTLGRVTVTPRLSHKAGQQKTKKFPEP